MDHIVNNFCDYYRELTLDGLPKLSSLYDSHALLEDPIHKIQGLSDIERYFKNMLTNLQYCRFDIDDVMQTECQAFITWVMKFRHPKLNKSNEIKVSGISHIKFNELITYHRDYYDLGSMVYEHIPLLKYVLNNIKQRMRV